MNIKLVDNHCHSAHSIDGESPMEDLCQQAVKMGFYAMTVTDHCEINEYISEGFRDAICNSVKEIAQLKQKFDGQIELLTGVELGQPMTDMDSVNDLLDIGDFDFILGSLHNLKGEPDFYFKKYDGIDIYALLKQYFLELCEMIEWGGFDSLAHITYPLRYIIGENQIAVDMKLLKPWLDESLALLVEKEIALEINTSGLRQKIGTTLPDLPVLTRFRELGGKYVTVGSDAHRTCDLGKGIPESYELIRKAGFGRLVYYKQHRPQEILLI